MNSPDEFYWRRKLAAFLHDTPSKCLDIPTHGERSRNAFTRAGFTTDDNAFYDSPSDHLAASADRFPFPDSKASGIRCQFDGKHNGFKHPLCGTTLHYHPFPSPEFGEEIEQNTQPSEEIELPSHWSEAEKWRARYFAQWRLWQTKAYDKDFRFAYLPADTRLPDHSIWKHMQVTSAIASCKEDNQLRPAFLSLKIGGVQNFISEARTTRDLWSGSFLLSWLMAAGLKRLSELAGPDSVIFPSLFGQPLFDLHWKAELWGALKVAGKPIYDGSMMRHEDKAITTPNLVNTFLAVVPACNAKDIARAVCDAMQEEWNTIAKSSWEYANQKEIWKNVNGTLPSEKRWQHQVDSFLRPDWQVLPWPETLEQAVELAKGLPEHHDTDKSSSLERVQAVQHFAEQWLKPSHRDSRYYGNGRLNNIGLGWSLISEACNWLMDASRQTKSFDAKAAEPFYGTHCNKDDLNGRDEAIAGGPGWADAMEKLKEPWNHLFRHNDWIAAPNFIKRVWPYAYLEKEWGIRVPAMPNTQKLSQREPNADDVSESGQNDKDGYFAVLALDGDQMGKWVSGAKNPKFKEQLADYEENGQKRGAVSYLKNAENGHDEKMKACPVLETQRPVSPSFSLQFSECLANFALYCARKIVEAHDGKLLYAGGDDVLAMLPATTAIACAEDLQAVFSGKDTKYCDTHKTYINPDGRPAQGFIVTTKTHCDQNGKPHVFMVPGPASSCSVGLAIAHAKQPLQDVVREAQAAEKRAKKQHGRAAVAVSLIKRSGETIQWGCQWASGGLELYQAILDGMEANALSAKFPYRVAELLSPYLQQTTGLNRSSAEAHEAFCVTDVIKAEFAFALERQSKLSGKAKREHSEHLSKLLDAFLSGTAATWENLEKDRRRNDVAHKENSVARNDFHLNAVIGLCQTLAFVRRQKDDSNSEA